MPAEFISQSKTKRLHWQHNKTLRLLQLLYLFQNPSQHRLEHIHVLAPLMSPLLQLPGRFRKPSQNTINLPSKVPKLLLSFFHAVQPLDHTPSEIFIFVLSLDFVCVIGLFRYDPSGGSNLFGIRRRR
jgi:hypothetical protein